jgi:K(+)-stimulated pyrophosphate-energized sodium pump
MSRVLEVLAGFSLGAESIALFARVGGGIYTKAADVGADLVGKVEAGIPEDDPRNPATIADNVGDNVGDVAGMGADLFGSYVATVLAAMVLGNSVIRDSGGIDDAFGGIGPILLPILIAGLGIIFSIIGMNLVRVKDNRRSHCRHRTRRTEPGQLDQYHPHRYCLLPAYSMDAAGNHDHEFLSARARAVSSSTNVFSAVMVGLVVGALISAITEYYTGLGKKPVLNIVRQSATGHATNVIAGLATGMMSTWMPIVLFCRRYLERLFVGRFLRRCHCRFRYDGYYGHATGHRRLRPHCRQRRRYCRNERAAKEVRGRTDVLDSVGNTTAAIGKGFAIASAALTALGLFAAYVDFTGIEGINIFKADGVGCLVPGRYDPGGFSALPCKAWAEPQWTW